MEVLEILKYILPSVIVFFTAYFILKAYFDKEYKEKDLELKGSRSKTIIPLRLQAYERLILLMERISPNQLIMRTNSSGLTVKQYQSILLQTIRSEFDHNLAQQMYVSSQAWTLLINAKEEIVKMINTSAGQMKDEANPQNLSTLILEKSLGYKKIPSIQAIDLLKKEVQELF
jgi:hypothetical protein